MNHRNIICRNTRIGILVFAAVLFLLPNGRLTAQDASWTPDSRFLDTLRNWPPVSARSIRFDVSTDGLLRIDDAWLRSAGVDPATVLPSQIRLYRLGKEIPLFRQGLDDGSFDTDDYLVFFGERPYDTDYRQLPQPDGPYPERMYRYADSTAYWLQLDGGGSAAGLPQRPFLQPSANDTLRWLYQTIHLEEDRSLVVFGGNIDRINTFAWVSNKTWVQSTLTRQSSTALIFPLPDMQAGEKSYFTAKLAGYQGEPSVSPNHSVQLRVNNSEARDSVQFDLGEQLFFTAAIPAGELTKGVDTVWLDSHPRVAKYSVVALDWADLEYAHRLEANDGVLQLREIPRVPQGKQLLELHRFSSSDPLVLCRRGDIWMQLETRINPDGMGGYSILLSDTLVDQMTIVASDVERIPAPPAGQLETISDPVASAAEYLILTHRSLVPAAASYAAFIAQEYGVTTAVVDVQDVYNSFSYGMFNP
jgi:Peptidase family C25